MYGGAFLLSPYKIRGFASPRKGRPCVEVTIDPTKKRMLLGIFDKGGEKEPAKGKTVAVPLTGGLRGVSFYRLCELQANPGRDWTQMKEGRGTRGYGRG